MNNKLIIRVVRDLLLGFGFGFLIGCILVVLVLTVSACNAHASGKKIDPDEGKYKVAVLDSGFSYVPNGNAGFKLCSSGHHDFDMDSATVGPDYIGHGSYVTELVNHEAKTDKICFLIYKIYGPGVPQGGHPINQALIKAYVNGAKAINMSFYMTQYSYATKKTLKFLTDRGVKIFVSAGNDSKNINNECTTYPVCYKGINNNMVIVGALDVYGKVASYSNTGARLHVYEFGDVGPMRGTSFASPRALGKYIRELKIK